MSGDLATHRLVLNHLSPGEKFIVGHDYKPLEAFDNKATWVPKDITISMLGPTVTVLRSEEGVGKIEELLFRFLMKHEFGQ